MKKRFWCVCIVSVLLLMAVPLTHGEQAEKKQLDNRQTVWTEIEALIKSNQIKEAFKLALKNEHNGNPKILAFLADSYTNGWGTDKDYNKAVYYYRKSADFIPYCKYRLGLFYAFGVGVPNDKDKALDLIDEACAAGYKISEKDSQQLVQCLQTELNEYTDRDIRLRFPSSSKNFKLVLLQRYVDRKKLGYSLRYIGQEDEWLDLYIYTMGLNRIPDGVSSVTTNHLEMALDAVKEFVRRGMYNNFRDLTTTKKGVLSRTGLNYEWFSFVYDPAAQKDMRSVTLILGARNRIIKIRYSGKAVADMPSKGLPTMVKDLLNHLDRVLTQNTEN